MLIGRVIPDVSLLEPEKTAAPVTQLLREGLAPVGRLLSRAEPYTRRMIGMVPPAMRGAREVITSLPTSTAWTGRGVGAALGAGVGAGVGAATAEEGQGLRGALTGAALGAGAGLAGGQLITRAGRGEVTRFGQRQLHSVTGYVPRTKQQIAAGKGMFGGGMDQAERIAALERMGFNPQEGVVQKGLTSIPGMVRGLGQKGERLQSLKEIMKAQGKVGIGLGVATSVPSVYVAAKERNPEAIGTAVGDLTGSVVGGTLPFVGEQVVSSIGRKAGGAIGKGIGRVVQKAPLIPEQVGAVTPA